MYTDMMIEEAIKQEYDEEANCDLDGIQILPDVEYDMADPQQEPTQFKSENSSQEYEKIGKDLTQQQKFVQEKYQKYKKLRRKLRDERLNNPKNR